TVTDEGHVKWVCIDHYRMNYQETSAKEFLRVLDSVGGSFSENVGRVDVRIRSRILAEQFFSALGKARSVYELDIVLDWACTGTDVQALEDALMKSVVSILHLDLQQFRPSRSSKLSSIPTRHEILYRIMNPPNMKSIHIALETGSTVTTLYLRDNSMESKGAQALTEALKTNSALTTLNLDNNSIGSDG
ncbi:hypothetical protein BGZ89_007981, partial [Linnemannia elongata]